MMSWRCRLYAHTGRLAATANALLLQKSLEHRLWDNSRCTNPMGAHRICMHFTKMRFDPHASGF